jgi:hydrogenase maturation protease
MHKYPKILIYGFGNPGRQDDALGVRLADAIDAWAAQNNYRFIETDTNYQLNIEDAATINDKDLVIFADASQEEIDNYVFSKLNPDSKVDYTMHHVAPAFIQYLCNEIYDKAPESFLLHIKGYRWEFLGEMTKKAESNLRKAIDFLINFLEQRMNGQSITAINYTGASNRT